MTFGSFNDSRHLTPMAEINVTPMVDVMLVLLVIFILAAPLFSHAIQLELPKAVSGPAPAKAATVVLAIDKDGIIYWDDIAITNDALVQRMSTAAARTPPPDLQLRADRATRYEVIAQVMSTAQANGLVKIGFVTDQPALAPVSATLATPALQLSPTLLPAAAK